MKTKEINLQNIVLRISIHNILLRLVEMQSDTENIDNIANNDKIPLEKYIELDKRLQFIFEDKDDSDRCSLENIENTIYYFMKFNNVEKTKFTYCF